MNSFGIMRKDMQKVYDYEARQQLKIFRGQCFNNSSVFHSQFPNASVEDIFNFAQELYDEGIKRNWIADFKMEEVK